MKTIEEIEKELKDNAKRPVFVKCIPACSKGWSVTQEDIDSFGRMIVIAEDALKLCKAQREALKRVEEALKAYFFRTR